MLSHLQSHALSFWHQVPLPSCIQASLPKFQSWYEFSSHEWVPTKGLPPPRAPPTPAGQNTSAELLLVTWNIDGSGSAPDARAVALIGSLQIASPDLICLQEVCESALATLLASPWMQTHWYSSEPNQGFKNTGQKFRSMTLVSKSCLQKYQISLGPLWRVPLPSRFQRDALCCDLLLQSSASQGKQQRTRLRLINVHLDSLPIQPSLRPKHLEIVAAYLRAAGSGVVAGDFNSVLPEDDIIIPSEGLIDAWMSLHPKMDGFTWGHEGDQPFPPARLDKIAMHRLEPSAISLLSATYTDKKDGNDLHPATTFSDHLGLLCVFEAC
jgi:tyrosyl-DNA phosphodiesterase 2